MANSIEKDEVSGTVTTGHTAGAAGAGNDGGRK